jgi:hypothetical protein
MKAVAEDGHLMRRHDEMICENQPAKERQTRGEAPADKWQQLVSRQRRHVERTRGGGGATTGVTRQPAGKQEANRRGGVRRQEAVDRREDEKRQRCDERHRDNQLEAPADKRRRRL